LRAFTRFVLLLAGLGLTCLSSATLATVSGETGIATVSFSNPNNPSSFLCTIRCANGESADPGPVTSLQQCESICNYFCQTPCNLVTPSLGSGSSSST
jgi:hypothetical protein